MQNTAREVIIANFVFILFWMVIVIIIWILGGRWKRTRTFRTRMIAEWKPALVITMIYLISIVLGGRNPVNPYAFAIFCQALIGLAIVRGIKDYQPLPVSESIIRRECIFRVLSTFITVGVMAGVLGMLIGSIGLGVAQSIFHEANHTQEAVQSFSLNKFQAFFLFLSGAGIAEETTYRLLLLSFFWVLTKKRRLSIFASAILFALYHLTPLDGMYLTFLQFPISQFIASALIGSVWGWVFVKRGYETTILAHTLSNWIPTLLFS